MLRSYELASWCSKTTSLQIARCRDDAAVSLHVLNKPLDTYIRAVCGERKTSPSVDRRMEVRREATLGTVPRGYLVSRDPARANPALGKYLRVPKVATVRSHRFQYVCTHTIRRPLTLYSA